MRSLPTVKISDGDGGYLVINQRDYDAKRHEIYDPEAAAETTDAPSLTDIDGIGKKTAKKMIEAGVETPDDLIAADATDLADAIGISPTQIEGWQEIAKGEAEGDDDEE